MPESAKKGDSLSKLSARKQLYIHGLAKGLTKKQAALDAGYSSHVAHSTKSHLETEDVQEAFARLIRQRVPAHKISQRIAEGLDAMETKFFQKEGVVTDTQDVIAWSERREYAKLAATFGGYFKDSKGKAAPEVEQKVLIMGDVNVNQEKDSGKFLAG